MHLKILYMSQIFHYFNQIAYFSIILPKQFAFHARMYHKTLNFSTL